MRIVQIIDSLEIGGAEKMAINYANALSVKIEFSGLRPGEKLFEELLAHNEKTLVTPHNKIRIASANTVDEIWVNDLIKWIKKMHDKNEGAIKEELKNWVKEYQGDIHAS